MSGAHYIFFQRFTPAGQPTQKACSYRVTSNGYGARQARHAAIWYEEQYLRSIYFYLLMPPRTTTIRLKNTILYSIFSMRRDISDYFSDANNCDDAPPWQNIRLFTTVRSWSFRDCISWRAIMTEYYFADILYFYTAFRAEKAMGRLYFYSRFVPFHAASPLRYGQRKSAFDLRRKRFIFDSLHDTRAPSLDSFASRLYRGADRCARKGYFGLSFRSVDDGRRAYRFALQEGWRCSAKAGEFQQYLPRRPRHAWQPQAYLSQYHTPRRQMNNRCILNSQYITHLPPIRAMQCDAIDIARYFDSIPLYSDAAFRDLICHISRYRRLFLRL